MASSSSSSSSSTSPSSLTFTWVADYEIALQPSSSSLAAPTMPTFNSNQNEEATMAPPTPLLSPHVDPEPIWSSPPPPNTPLAKLWTIRRRSASSSSGNHALAGLAGLLTSTTPKAQTRPFLLADAMLRQDKDVCELLLRGLGGGDNFELPAQDEKEVEHVSWVDNHGHDLLPPTSGGLPRPLVHRLNILHKGAGILVRNEHGQVYVHQRAAHKRIFPSMHDMFVGGVSLFREDTRETAGRELKEELGFGREEGEEEEEEKEEEEGREAPQKEIVEPNCSLTKTLVACTKRGMTRTTRSMRGRKTCTTTKFSPICFLLS